MIKCDVFLDNEPIDSLFQFNEIPHKGDFVYLEGHGEYEVIKVLRYFRASDGRFSWYPEELSPEIYLSSGKK